MSSLHTEKFDGANSPDPDSVAPNTESKANDIDGEYASGAALHFTALALVLSIFLVSLDMVCSPFFAEPPLIPRRRLLRLLSPRSRMNSTALISWLGTVPRFSCALLPFSQHVRLSFNS